MNRPYDEWVKEMLSSSGAYWEKATEVLGTTFEMQECNSITCLTQLEFF